MRKLKSKFKKNYEHTELMRNYFTELANNKDYKFIGVYNYKNYEIFYDIYPVKNQLLKHISLKNKDFKEVNQKDLEIIINHFIGENFNVQYGVLNENIINVYEKKINF